MVLANKIIRKYKTNEERKIELMKAGFSEKLTDEMLKVNCFGGIGFERYELTNNNANIKRLKERLEKIKKLKTMDNFEKVYSSGIKLEDAPSENRIRIFFNKKPNSTTIAELKRHAFRWTPSLGCWQAYRNSRSMEFAKNTANKEA